MTYTKDLIASFLKFWKTCDFKGKVGVIVAAIIALALVILCFIFPIAGLGILSGIVLIFGIWCFIWAYDAYEDYQRYYKR